MADDNFLLRRLNTYAGWAAALFGGILALLGCVIATLAGSAPSPTMFVAIVLGVALMFALLARFLIARIPWFGLGTYAASRVAARWARRRDR